MHARQQIRDAVVTLITGLATTGSRVYNSRVFELEQAELPCWNVSTMEEAEESEPWGMGRQQLRQLTLSCTGISRQLTGQAKAEQLDLMCEELETVLTASALQAVVDVSDLVYVSTEWESDTDDTDQAIGRATVQFRVEYVTTQGAPASFD